MNNVAVLIVILVLIPIIVVAAILGLGYHMNAAVVAILGGVMIYLAYSRYARRIDRDVINSDPKKATPAKMYMDGVDFMPTSRNVLYGYHFKSIAAAGPIVGVIAAANLWGWVPSILWLILGVTFIGWCSDYSAIMVAVRNEGNSLSAIAHKLIAPRTRLILFVFIFFYLLLLAGAFVGILAGVLDARADVPFGIFMLAVMGLLTGQALYRWKMDLIAVTLIAVLAVRMRRRARVRTANRPRRWRLRARSTRAWSASTTLSTRLPAISPCTGSLTQPAPIRV